MLGKYGLPIVLTLALSLLLPESLSAQSRPKKKIVEYGWDVPYPDFVRDNIREMEKRPFEGLIFRTKGFDHVFDVRPWNKADFQPQLDTLAQIQWQKFTDNFLTLYAANQWKMDWFNDDQWKVITENMKLFSLAVKSANCVGVCFDPSRPGTIRGRIRARTERQVVRPGRRQGPPAGTTVHGRFAGTQERGEGPEFLSDGPVFERRR